LKYKVKKQIKTKIKNLKSGDPIIVEWMDAGYDDNDPISWSDIKQVAELKEILIKSTGFFITATPNTIFFCMSMEQDKEGTNIANKGQIPVGCIKTIKKWGDECEK
tara:strand:- start:1583 stop:1900 length:318 start_codon:yes stop_codon:yes gene_type:complete